MRSWLRAVRQWARVGEALILVTHKVPLDVVAKEAAKALLALLRLEVLEERVPAGMGFERASLKNVKEPFSSSRLRLGERKARGLECHLTHVFGPLTSTFSNMGKVAPYLPAKARISSGVPGSWPPNWLHGKARTANSSDE